MLAIALSPEIPVPPILPASETIDSSSLTAAVGSVSSTESITHSPESFAVEFSNSANGAIAPSEWLVAQNVRPAGDGVGTTVGQVGDQFNIQDGRRSGNNLFHSFEAFGLDADQTANFISEVGIENILGRVTGGDPSVINGIIRVSEGNSNLYLINPAGILFGADASLNLAGSFTATTANGIGFDEGWFSATGENNFASLIGEPERFAFTTSEPGAIVNSGNLSVLAGNSLSLIGGTVISTGTLTAPGGDTAAIEPRGVTIATVPGENLVRISQEGSLLSLDVQPLGSDRPNALPFTPASLPELLTGGEIDHATDLIVNPDGSVQLTTGRTVETGDIIASRISTATDVSVNLGNVVAESGDVLLQSTNAIAAGTIDTSAEATALLDTSNATATAGEIRLLANAGITVGAFDTSALAQVSGSVTVATAIGGDIWLESSVNGSNIRFTRIDTTAQANSRFRATGIGGNVEIFANGTVRGTGTGTTINTQGTITEGRVTNIADGGSVTVQHDGGPNNVPFIVGDASENGTAGAINTGEVTLTNETFATVGTETRGARNEVSVTFANTAPTLPQASQIPQIELGQPISFTLAELNLIASDANADSTTIQIVAIASGRLTRNGVVLRPGDTVSPNDVLVYTPPAETLGDLDAFSVRASDRLSVSTPVAVNFNVVEPIPPSVTDPSPPRTDLPTPPDAFPVEQLPLNLQVSTDRLLGEPLAQSPQLTPLIVLDVVWPEPLLLLLPPRQFLQGIPLDGTSGEDTAGGQSGTLTDFTAGSRPTFGTPDNPDDTNPGPLTEPDADIVEDSTPPNPDDSGEPIEPDSSNPDSSPTFEPPADETVAVAPTDEEPSTAAPSVDGDLVNSSPNLNSDRVVTSPDRSIEQRIQNCQAQAERIQATDAADRSEGLYALLINCYEQNLAIAQAAENFEWQAYSLNNLAISHFVIGNYQQAIDYHQQQLQLAQEAGDQTQVGIALSGIGAAYGALGDYPTAIDYYTQGLEKISVTVAPQWRSLTLRNLGNAYLMQKDYEQAIEYQNASLTLSQSVGDRYGEMQTLGNLGNAYTGTREFDRAITYHQQSIALARELTNRLQEAQALLNLGTTHSYRHDYIQAVTHHEQSLIIMRELRARLGEGIALTNLGDALFNLDRLPEAEQALFAGIEVWESLRAGLGNNDALKVSIFETQSATYRNLQEVLADQDKAAIALEVSERGRARAFVELIARDAAGVDQEQFAVEPPNLSQLRQTAIDQNATLVEYSIIREQAVDTPHGASEQSLNEPQESELFIWVIAPTGEVTFRRVDLRSLPSLSNASLAELANVARQGIRGEGVARDSSTHESRTGDNAALTPGDLVRRLGEPSSWQPYQVTAVDLDAGTVTLSHPEITLPAPVALAEVYPVESQRPQVRRSQYRRLQQLHQILIEPIADLLPNDPNERVIFVPQEYLFLVPFAALQAPDGQYLIEQHTLLTTSAVQVLELSQQRPASAAQTAVVVGNPAPMPGSLAPLPYAEAEAEAIAQLLNTTAITGTDATETAIRQRLSDAQIIHFATHGLFNETHPLQGAIALTPSTAEEDGFLTAAEILDLSLNAELVVLSACNTGRGKITGDGVVGLSRSLIAAGAPSVMVSLWQVPDDATSQLMVNFYRYRQQFDDAQALRQSMLSAMQTYPNPRDWAAFTLVGSTPQR